LSRGICRRLQRRAHLQRGFNLPEPLDVTAEVQQHWAGARSHSRHEPTEGMVRGMKAVDLGVPITVPWDAQRWTRDECARETRGPVGALRATQIIRSPAIAGAGPAIHVAEMFETGIKVVDLIQRS